jgi:hypothetical protein
VLAFPDGGCYKGVEGQRRPAADAALTETDGDRIAMLGVMMSQGEVMVIVVITAVIVFVVARKRKIDNKK